MTAIHNTDNPLTLFEAAGEKKKLRLLESSGGNLYNPPGGAEPGEVTQKFISSVRLRA